MGGDCPDFTNADKEKMLTSLDKFYPCLDGLIQANNNLNIAIAETKKTGDGTTGEVTTNTIENDTYIFDTFLINQVRRYIDDTSKNFFKIYKRLEQKIEVIKLQEEFLKNTCELNKYYVKDRDESKDKFEKIQSKINMNNRMTEYYDEKVENINVWTYYGKYIYWLVITILTAILCYVSYKAGYITAVINFIKKKLGLDKVKEEIDKKKLVLPNRQFGGTKKEKEEKEEHIFKFLFKRIKEEDPKEIQKKIEDEKKNNKKQKQCYGEKYNYKENNFFTEEKGIYPVIKHDKIKNKDESLFDTSTHWLKHKNIYKNIQKCEESSLPQIKIFHSIPKGIKRFGRKRLRKLGKPINITETTRGRININEFETVKELYETLKSLNLSFLEKLSYYYKFMKNYHGITDDNLKTKNIYDVLLEKHDDIKGYYEEYGKDILIKELNSTVSKDEKGVPQFLKKKKNTINNKLDSRYMKIYAREKEKYIKDPKLYSLFHNKKGFFDFAVSSTSTGSKHVKLGRLLGDWDKIKDKYEITSKRGVYKLKKEFEKDKPRYSQERKDSYGKEKSVIVVDKKNIKNNKKYMKSDIDMKQRGKDMNRPVISTIPKIPKTPKFYIILLLFMLITPVIAIPFCGPIIRFFKPYLFPYT